MVAPTVWYHRQSTEQEVRPAECNGGPEYLCGETQSARLIDGRGVHLFCNVKHSWWKKLLVCCSSGPVHSVAVAVVGSCEVLSWQSLTLASRAQ